MLVVVAVGAVAAAPGTVAVDRLRAARRAVDLRHAPGTEGCMMGRQRRVPTRTCVVCRERRQKDGLLRIVRTPEGRVVFDPTGRLNGRGAYICSDADHWGEGVSVANRGKLNRALKTEIDELTMRTLSQAIVLKLAK